MKKIPPAKGASKRERAPSVQVDAGTLIQTRRQSLGREAYEHFEVWQRIGDDRYLRAAQLLEALGNLLGQHEYFPAGEKPKFAAAAINKATCQLREFTGDNTTRYPDVGHRKPQANRLLKQLVGVLEEPEYAGKPQDIARFLDVNTRSAEYEPIFGRPESQADRTKVWTARIKRIVNGSGEDGTEELAKRIIRALARAPRGVLRAEGLTQQQAKDLFS
jgi:hypothetical protein